MAVSSDCSCLIHEINDLISGLHSAVMLQRESHPGQEQVSLSWHCCGVEQHSDMLNAEF